ncbi:hypothetical protein E4U13_001796 [Claviceps humidiphila]|uniref:DUF8004 domain-containing protein n=1 Tax=Claviceps humidiphila TaxID=1294629 RepID=A0A9P7Q1W9_9HYPO|nr:hypothetical protein E4U13_001796 [Claviceps humidiphila]
MPSASFRETSQTSRPSSSRRSSGAKSYLNATATNNRFWNSSSNMKLKRWDGTKRISTSWGGLQEDYELRTRNGNCFIYLHSYETVHGGPDAKMAPSFILPFSLLLAHKCYALIERFLASPAIGDSTSGHRRSPRDVPKLYHSDPKQRVELFMPTPRGATERQRQRHQLSTRNFFAWVLGKSLVGETLGEALVGLLESMYEYRSGISVDNVADLVRYLQVEGYLSLARQPDHALAVLRLAETFRLKTLYLEALSHCVAMGDLVSGRPDLQHVSLATRELMHASKNELDTRLKKTSDMLQNFLDHELSESQLGIPAGIRVHLELFRTFLLSFYSAKMGYYPPLEFDGCMYRAMARDFTALYNLLVDEGYSSDEAMPSVAVGGLCTLQLIQSFDACNGFEPMKHPLPRLPHRDEQSRSGNRIPWPSLRAKSRNNERHLDHVSLVQASNWRQESFENGLVKAYRKFEEECALFPRKLSRDERVSLVDGRKIRWILVYGVHQTLQHATQLPAGVTADLATTQIVSLVKSTKVPWEDGTLSGGIPRSQTEPALSRLREQQQQQQQQQSDTAVAAAKKRIEIKPDIDYFALTHKEEDNNATLSSALQRRKTLPANSRLVTRRSNSFKQAFSSQGTIRKSLRRLNKASSAPTTTTATPMTSTAPSVSEFPYHEAIHAYLVDSAGQSTPSTELTSRSTSTASNTRYSNVSTVSSSTTSSSSTGQHTAEAIITCFVTPQAPLPLERSPSSRRWSVHQDSSTRLSKSKSVTKRRPMSTVLDGGYNYAVKAFGHLVDHERRGSGPGRQRDEDVDDKRAPSSSLLRGRFMSLTKRDSVVINQEPYDLGRNDSDDWTAMQRFLDDQEVPHGVSDAWAQYADLGGLTEMK